MASRQDSDRQYDQFHASWLASQRDAPLNIGGFGGASHGSRYGELDHFSRSPMVFPRQSSSSADAVDHLLRIVAQADHDTLLRSGNAAYADALALHNGTKIDLESVKCVLVTLYNILVKFSDDV